MNLQDLAEVMGCSLEELKKQLNEQEVIKVMLKEKAGKKQKEEAFVKEVF